MRIFWVLNRKFIKKLFFSSGKLNIPKSFSQSTRGKVIKLKLGRVSVQGTEISSSESYHIQINTSDLSIIITGTGNTGVFYAVQTLLALITKEGQVPEVQIKDSPRFSYRGLMVDIARNFQPKNEILKLLDGMAMYKMNKLHFHLADNEGWRLEIPGIEELTSVSIACPRRPDNRAWRGAALRCWGAS